MSEFGRAEVEALVGKEAARLEAEYAQAWGSGPGAHLLASRLVEHQERDTVSVSDSDSAPDSHSAAVKAIEHALSGLGFDGVGQVRQGKVFDIELTGSDKAKAEADLKAMCDKLLANTVIENYAVEVA